MESPELTKVAALERADRAWRDWQAFSSRESRGKEPDVRGTDGWTLAEAVAHIARWQDWAVQRIADVLAGTRLEELPVDAMNARWAEQDEGVAYADATRRLDEAWGRLRKAVESVPDGAWSKPIETVVAANTWEHYEEHKAWRPDSATLSH